MEKRLIAKHSILVLPGWDGWAVFLCCSHSDKTFSLIQPNHCKWMLKIQSQESILVYSNPQTEIWELYSAKTHQIKLYWILRVFYCKL